MKTLLKQYSKKFYHGDRISVFLTLYMRRWSQKPSDILIRILQIMDAIKAQLQTVLHTRVLTKFRSLQLVLPEWNCFVNLVELAIRC